VNLAKLFESQKILRDRIDYNEPDRFEKLVLALLVEIGECANEWRGFKFWSKDQKPRTKTLCVACAGVGEVYQPIDGIYIECPHCEGKGREESKNPLLEEYVDGFHFTLELGIELGVGAEQIKKYVGNQKKSIGTMENHFGYLYNRISELMDTGSLQDKQFKLVQIFNALIGLGYRLGFTWEQIEQAYYAKNQINHQRQSEGY
jgi:dimeric dUTPase (all-alpha-NTP-PPase superfamily)